MKAPEEIENIKEIKMRILEEEELERETLGYITGSGKGSKVV